MPDDLVAVALEFDLPFALLVADGFGPRRKPDHADFQFTAHEIPITLRFARRLRTDKSTLVDLSQPQEAASYTRAQIWFDGPALQARTGARDFRDRAEELIDLAMSVVNRYIVLYRELTGGFWLRALTRREVAEFAFVGFLQDGRKVTLFYEERGGEPTAGGAPDPAVEQALRERFVAAYDPDPTASLALTARDLLERGEHWQAALAVNTLFEVKLARLLRRWLGDPEALLDGQGHPRSAADLLHTHLREVTTGDVYRRWEESVGAFRKALAQGEAAEIGEKEAGDAIVAVWGLLEELERLLAGRASHEAHGSTGSP